MHTLIFLRRHSSHAIGVAVFLAGGGHSVSGPRPRFGRSTRSPARDDDIEPVLGGKMISEPPFCPVGDSATLFVELLSWVAALRPAGKYPLVWLALRATNATSRR